MLTDQAYRGSGDGLVLAVSLELAAAKWKVAFHDGRREKPAIHTVTQPQAAARLQAVLNLIENHNRVWLPGDAGSSHERNGDFRSRPYRRHVMKIPANAILTQSRS
jgi:hypothetical protein